MFVRRIAPPDPIAPAGPSAKVALIVRRSWAADRMTQLHLQEMGIEIRKVLDTD